MSITLTIIGIGMLAKFLFDNLDEIIEGFLCFTRHILGWAGKMFHNFGELLQKGARRLYVVEVDVSRIPPDIIPKEKLAHAKKIPLGVLTDSEGTPVAVDTTFIPSKGMDREFRQHLDEGGGAIELSV